MHAYNSTCILMYIRVFRLEPLKLKDLLMYLILYSVYLCNEICSTSILFALFQALISLEDRISQCEEVQDFFSVEEDDLNPPTEDE